MPLAATIAALLIIVNIAGLWVLRSPRGAHHAGAAR
jgi:hypothetical protein